MHKKSTVQMYLPALRKMHFKKPSLLRIFCLVRFKLYRG